METKNFIISITITKGDQVGNILSRMASGCFIAFDTFEEGERALQEFRRDALAVVKNIESRFNMFGSIALHDEAEGSIRTIRSLSKVEDKIGR